MPRRPGTHVDDPASVGARLRAARQRAGLSQRELAFEGCTAAYISRVEGGFRIPSLQILQELARRLGTTAEHLATGGATTDPRRLLEDAEFATRLGRLDEGAEVYARLRQLELVPRDAIRLAAGLAEIAFQRGDTREVVALLADVELDGGNGPDPETVAWISDRLGRAYAQLGEFESALATLGRGLEIARRAGDELAQLRLSTLLANAVLDRGDPGRAEELLGDALLMAERARDPLEVARIWWSQARLHIQQQRSDVAARYVRKTIGLLEASEHGDFAATAFQLLARLENDRGNHADALELVERGAAPAANRYHQALFEIERARALAGLGDAEQAGAVAMRAARLLEDTDPSSAGRSYAVVADVFRSLGDDARAREVYELAAERLPESDPFQAEIYASLGELLEAAGDDAEAMRAYKRAAQVRARAARD